ncbi:MAG: NAD(P)-binding protein [Vicinamibacterales bacterium]
MSDLTKQKVAVLGGGLGSLTTVYGLTSDPAWRDNYDITVYEMGWRLGGKGASGRNAQQNMRIEEHGLHIWMGFYENAFQMMQTCYAERAAIDDRRGSSNALRSWDDAFKPQSFMVIDEYIDRKWAHWPMTFPTNPGVPGDGKDLMTPWEFMVTAIRLIGEHFGSSDYQSRANTDHDITGDRQQGLLEKLRADVDHAQHVLAKVVQEVEMGLLVSTGLFIDHALHIAERMAGGDHTAENHGHLAWLLKEFRNWFWRQIKGDVDRSTAARRLWTQMDVALTMVAGSLDDGVMLNGFEAIDDEEFKDWLRRHGASAIGINNALNDSLYEGAFAYVGGDQQKPNMGAGAVTQSFFRLAGHHAVFRRARAAVVWLPGGKIEETGLQE